MAQKEWILNIKRGLSNWHLYFKRHCDFFPLVYMTELWVSPSPLYANNQNITVPSECHFMFEGRFSPKHTGLLKTFQTEQHELFSLNKNRRIHNDFRGFIFVTAELLGCAFKLHFPFLRRASLNIRTYSLCSEKEKKISCCDMCQFWN